MADTAADVPGKFDIIIDGKGYVFWNALMQSLPFRNQRAAYYYYPTFLERTNVSGNYGDDSQAFWLTATQSDWSEGAGRRYFRSADADLVRRYWQSDSVDPVTIPGQVTLCPDFSTTLAMSQNVYTAQAGGASGRIYLVGTTNAFWIQQVIGGAYSTTGIGAHGVGAAPGPWATAYDGTNLFVSSTGVGTNGVRKYDGVSAWTTFSATGFDSLCFLNNTLYGYVNSTSTLYTIDTSGTATASFQWKNADGSAQTTTAQLCAYGGKLLIARYANAITELWEYDGTGVAKLTDFPVDFYGFECKVVAGVVFISGLVNKLQNYTPTIFYYSSGTLGQLWQATSSALTSLNQYPAMSAYGEGLCFTDETTGSVFQYDIGLGGVHSLGSFTPSTQQKVMAGSQALLILAVNNTTPNYFPSTVQAGSGTLTTSLFDFDNSLTKTPRGIKVEFDSAIDGDGGSVDIAYQYDSVDGSFTTLQLGATSGVEYQLPTTTCHSIAVQVTLNLGSSLLGPVLKRTFVRAAPLLSTFRRAEYDLDLTGVKGIVNEAPNPVQMRNGNDHPLMGMDMALNLKTSMLKTTPISVTDRLGTYTAVFEHGPNVSEFDEVRPGEFIAHVTLREV